MKLTRTLIFTLASAVSLFAADRSEKADHPGKSKGTPRGEIVTFQHRTLTLDDAIQLALQQNPQILNAKQEIQRTRGLVVEVTAQALPHIVASAGYTQQEKTLLAGGGGGVSALSNSLTSDAMASTTTSGTGASSSNGQSNSTNGSIVAGADKLWTVSVQVTQTIYSGSVGPAIKIAKLTQDSTIFNLRDLIDTVVDNTRKQFYDVLLNRALITVQEEALKLLENQLADQVNRFEAGTVPRFNVLQAEVAVANQRPNVIRARNAYSIAMLTLAKTLNLPYDPVHPGAPFEVAGSLEVHPRDFNVNEAIATAKARRPFLKVQRQNILIQAQNIKVQLAGYQPSLTANAGYEARKSSLSKEFDDYVKGWFFGVNGTWNIWDGGATYGRVKQARASLEEAKATYDDSVHQVELEVQQAVDNLKQARETLESQLKTVEQALESVRLAQERLNAGAGVQLDVLNAQVQLTQARSTVLQAQHDYLSALADYEKATATATQYDELFDDPLMQKARALTEADSQRSPEKSKKANSKQ